MPINPVIWFEIYAQDLERAKTFYETVLQLQLTPLMSDDTIQMLAFPMEMDQVGAGGALVKMEGVCSGGGGTLIYFHSDDCAVEVGRVAAAGGEVHKEKTSIGQHGYIALARDTEGNMFGIHSMS